MGDNLNTGIKYYTTAEIREMLNGCKRDYVSKLARARKWRFEIYKRGNCIAKKYLAEDVDREIERRKQKELCK